MNEISQETRERFNALYEEWKEASQHPEVRLSSRPEDYINNEPYRKMVAMGREALPLVIEKLEQGEFLLNQAVADMEGVGLDELIKTDQPFPSEQEKSRLLIQWWQSKQD